MRPFQRRPEIKEEVHFLQQEHLQQHLRMAKTGSAEKMRA